jgi:hypothetical protein
MGSMFRCVPNFEKKEYILKAGGVVQSGYSYKTYLYKYEDGWYSYSASYASASYCANCGVYYRFNATNWNKIYIKKLYGAGFNNTGIVGVCSSANPYASDFEYANIKEYVYPHGEKDYVFDISGLSGEYTFFIYASTKGYTNSSYTDIDIRGDVYLSEK